MAAGRGVVRVVEVAVVVVLVAVVVVVVVMEGAEMTTDAELVTSVVSVELPESRSRVRPPSCLVTSDRLSVARASVHMSVT